MSSSLSGLLIIIIVIFFYTICLLGKNKFSLNNLFYEKRKARALRSQISNSIEEGSSVHCDISNLDESGAITGGAMVALNTTRKLSSQLSSADEPLFITNNNSTVTFFEKDAIKNGMKQSGLENEYDPNCSVYAGFSPLSHQSGMISILDGSTSAVHLNMGSFGAEIALQDLAFDSSEGIIAAGESLASQAVAYVTADEPFFGEEIFELPQMVESESGLDSSLIVMDLLRFGLILALIAGTLITILT